MLKKFLKKLLVIVLISSLGLAAGYYSAPLLKSYFGDGRISVLIQNIQ